LAGQKASVTKKMGASNFYRAADDSYHSYQTGDSADKNQQQFSSIASALGTTKPRKAQSKTRNEQFSHQYSKA